MKTFIKNLMQPSFDEESVTYVAKPGVLEQQYKQLMSEGEIHYDAAQMQTLQKLQALLANLQQYAGPPAKGWQKLLTPTPPPCRSLYIYGEVGCGKSMLMDLFFNLCPVTKKRRIHFHAFMQEVHKQLHLLRKTKSPDCNPIQQLAENISVNTKLLCFDEFHVTDIADAMILERLFSELFRLGVVLVATSNRHPDQLYLGGLQRELFLAFVALLKTTADIQHLSSHHDYRLEHQRASDTRYYYPLNEFADSFLQQHFLTLCNQAPKQAGQIIVSGRIITLSVVHDRVAFLSFDELCKRPLGAADYLAIAQDFDTLLMAEIPRFLPQHRNEAKRFVTLIDILYENKVQLICTAAVKASQLYTQGDGSFEFDRTVSRLMDMQSQAYMQTPKTNVK